MAMLNGLGQGRKKEPVIRGMYWPGTSQPAYYTVDGQVPPNLPWFVSSPQDPPPDAVGTYSCAPAIRGLAGVMGVGLGEPMIPLPGMITPFWTKSPGQTFDDPSLSRSLKQSPEQPVDVYEASGMQTLNTAAMWGDPRQAADGGSQASSGALGYIGANPWTWLALGLLAITLIGGGGYTAYRRRRR